MQNISILMFIDHLGGGGAQEYVYQLCRSIDQSQFDIQVCALHTGGVNTDKFKKLGIPITILVKDKRWFRFPLIVWRIYKILRTGSYDLVHTYLQGSFILCVPIARLLGVPIIHSVLANRYQVQNWYLRSLKWYKHWVYLYLSYYDLQFIDASKEFSEKVKISEVVIDISEMLSVQHDSDQAIPPYELSGKYPIAVSVGRLHPDKGHEYGILAWSLIVREFPDAMLLILGGGEDEERLVNLTKRLNITNSIVFAGFREDLSRVYRRVDFFLRTSINEGTNFATVFALAAGLPVIGFNNPGPMEIIEHMKTGMLVPTSDSEAIARVVLKLSRDMDLRNSLVDRARKQMRKRYDLARVIRYHEDTYRLIADNTPSEIIPGMR